jgi:hypothetical protein
MWGIPKGFPKSAERVGSRLHGFPFFPHSVISMACFSRDKCWIDRYAATKCNVPPSPWDAHRYSSLGIECIGDLSPTEAALTATFGQAAGKPFLRNLS